ncbi:DNA-3-methyladenine glycosylase II [Evansella vedderi]|uniref:DNA-3-methyladenine glycosylase II n=1 Tax=Evansella vedderi TaxID=38282 RepID=A0ABT9ZUY2_9BACI|nr:DNA-3-methyladenine glycosylase [Evansella vedderi]MDQ0253945.1 DNA-3-methyladenine glycosylase II [Evansella vedderi]
MDEHIIVQGPYNFFQALKRLKIDPLYEINLEKQSIKVPLWMEGTAVVVHITHVGTVEEPRFHIKTMEAVHEEKVIKELRRIFHWDISLHTVYEHFQQTDLHSLFETFRGTPFVCDFSLYGCLMKTIIHQQLNMAFAYELSKRFIQTFGVEKEGQWFYPSAERVSELKVEQLRELQFSQRKGEYVIDTSKLIAEGKLHLDRFLYEEDEKIIKELVAIRGIGRWTAECFLMFGLGRTDLFPVQDIGIQNGMKKYYGLDRKPSLEEMVEKSEGWKPYRTYASLYLWESLEVD